MEKYRVIEEFCSLSQRVMHQVFKYEIPADCFCHQGEGRKGDFLFNEKVMDFIQEAVREAIKAHKQK